MDDVRARRPGRWSRVRAGVVVVAEYATEALYGFLRPQWHRSGATMREEAERLPGDEVIVRQNWQATRAITVHRPPAQVWPWLAQAGYGRGGWYGDLPWWKDPAGHKGVRSSTATVLAEHQEHHEGDVLLDGPNCDAGTGAWRVVALDRHGLWCSTAGGR